MHLNLFIALIIVFLFGCINDINRSPADFPDNRTSDFDGDGLTEQEGDCDDLNPDLMSAPTWYADSDLDGFGDSNVTKEVCEQPVGYVANSEDCLDSDQTVYPGNARFELDGACVLDVDNDGFGDSDPQINVDAGMDCDDSNGAIHPLVVELCDGIDNDCNGEVDDYTGSNAPSWFLDLDGDGFGDPEQSMSACEPPPSYTADNSDCDDSDPLIFPNGPEYCIDGDSDGDGLDDAVDNNCNGVADEASALDIIMWYADADGDGFGNIAVTLLACEQPEGYIYDNTDCNDNNISIFPQASEYCNTVDDDCDGQIDESDALDTQLWYFDGDGDGYGSISQSQVQCEPDVGYILTGGDCDDTSTAVRPDAAEYCNAVDDDCDGDIDELAIDERTYFLDGDGDGHGSGQPIISCPSFNSLTGLPETPFGYSTEGDDCDDSDASRAPSLPELCTETIDENCDNHMTLGATDVSTWYADSDGDGQGNAQYNIEVCVQPEYYVDNNLDCNDNDPEVLSGMPVDWEICNGKLDRCEDNDGNLTPPSDELDGDGDAYVICSLDIDPLQWGQQNSIPLGGDDCDDFDIFAYPNALEQCNGVIDDCNALSSGLLSSQEVDDDGDGYVECETDMSNWVGDPSVLGGGDCNDSSIVTFVGAAASNPNICAQDADGDGFPDCNLTGIHQDYSCDLGIFHSVGTGPDFVFVPAGADPLGRYSISNDFYMMTTEVTEAMWDAVMGSGLLSSQSPQDSISWHMLAEYANALSVFQGLTPCYSCSNGSCIESIDPNACQAYRIPTEAEWELAARSYCLADFWTGAGNSLGGDPSSLYCTNDIQILDGINNPFLSDYTDYCATSKPESVAEREPNGFGLYDMHGGLREWTGDWSGGGFPFSQMDPWSGVPTTMRVTRGGSYINSPFQLGSGARLSEQPELQGSSMGGRLVIQDP